MKNIDFGAVLTAQDKATGVLATAKAAALDRLYRVLEDGARAYADHVPVIERSSWPAKGAAAQAVLAGAATADQTRMLAAEAEVTGESVAGLAANIAARAAEHARTAAYLAGLRRSAQARIGAARDVAEIDAALARVQHHLEAAQGRG